MQFSESTGPVWILNLLLSLYLVALSHPVQAAPVNSAKSNPVTLQQAEALIADSGIKLQINQIPEALIQAGQQQSGPASTFIQPLMHSMQTVFIPEEMVDTLSQELVSRLDVPTMLDALKWYQSENGQSIVNAHKALLNPEVTEKIAKVIASQEVNLSAERKALLQKVATSTQSTDIALETMVNIQAAFMTALSNMIAPQKAQSFDQLREAFGSSKHKMRGQFAHQLLLQQAVLMEPISNATLEEFLHFADSASGKKFFTALNAALDQTLQIYARRLPDAIHTAARAK